MKKGGVFLLFILLTPAVSAQAESLDGCAGIVWGSGQESAKSSLLSQAGVVFDDQRTGAFGWMSLHGGRLFDRPVKRWYMVFLDNMFCQALVDFELYRDVPPLSQCRRLREEFSAIYGRVSRNYEMPMSRDPSWQECAVRKPSFQCDWDITSLKPSPSPSMLRIFLHGSSIERAVIRVVFTNHPLQKERMRREAAMKSGVRSTSTVAAAAPQPVKPRAAAPLFPPAPPAPLVVAPAKISPPKPAAPSVVSTAAVTPVAATATSAAVAAAAAAPVRVKSQAAITSPTPAPAKHIEPEEPASLGTAVLFWFLIFSCVGMLLWLLWLFVAVLMKRD